MNFTVISLYMSSGWQLEKFATLLPQHTVQEITTFHSIQPGAGRDEVMWAGTPSGSFTTKTTYELICSSHSLRHSEALWKAIWHIKGPQHIRVFLWKLCDQGILTNNIHVRRHMTNCDLCPLCRSSAEDYLHVFRDCSESRSF